MIAKSRTSKRGKICSGCIHKGKTEVYYFDSNGNVTNKKPLISIHCNLAIKKHILSSIDDKRFKVPKKCPYHLEHLMYES